LVGDISILHDTVLKFGCDVLLYGLDFLELDYRAYDAQDVDEAIMIRLNTTLHVLMDCSYPMLLLLPKYIILFLISNACTLFG